MFDPLAALAADAALTPSSLAAIDLGVQIEILQAQLAVGELLAATILPPQGGSDRLSLLGQTVLAQLPPGIDPGETLLLQVTGFTGNQILVRNLGIVDRNNPPPTSTVVLPGNPSTPSTQATLTTILSPKGQLPNGSPPSPSPAPNAAPAAASVPVAASAAPSAPSSAPVAPSRAVFVAASVQPAKPTTPTARLFDSAVAEVAQDVEQLGLEARIAATRAAFIDIGELATGKPSLPSAAVPQPSASPAPQSSTVPAPSVPPAPSSVSPVPGRVQLPLEPLTAEAALLARLRVPQFPSTLAAARLLNTATAALPRLFARLDALLAGVVPSDERAGSLRTLLAFLTRLDPSNARALPEQLMAYVDNVVAGAEGKLASIVRLIVASQAESGAQPQTSAPTAPPPASAQTLTAAVPDAPTAAESVVPAPVPAPVVSETPAQTETTPAMAAHIAERTTALQYDLKGAIVSMLESPGRDASAPLESALTETLTTVTAVQLNVLNAQSTDPNVLAIPLPVFYHESGRPVQLRISRDAPHGGKLDADNFHIAFVLDTRTLGTVAVDVQTAARTVSVSVKTEGSYGASRFKETFDDLRGRLEQLRYRVASIGASVAPRRGDAASVPASRTPASPESNDAANLDTRA